MTEPQKKYKELCKWFKPNKKYAIAFSGGVDSCLVLFAARQVAGKENTKAIISDSPSLKRKDLGIARNFCEQYNIDLIEINANEINNENYANNPVNRCYFCKTALYSAIEDHLITHLPEFTVLNGSNVSDFGDFRPGLKAADERKVKSPLYECNFTKNDIRNVGRHVGLPTWNKPASPCLSSRFHYGEKITIERLNMVEAAEAFLEKTGFETNRVRYKNNTATVEVPVEQVQLLKEKQGEVSTALISLGFNNVIIDSEGFKSGKLNADVSLNVQSKFSNITYSPG